MTSNIRSGFVVACASRLFGTMAVLPAELNDEALPATGTTSTAASARVIIPRFPLPQSAFERESPRRPHSAFARTPVRIVRSCRMYEAPSARELFSRAAVERPVGQTQGRSGWGSAPPPFAVGGPQIPPSSEWKQPDRG